MICDKPMTTNLEDAKSLVEVVAETNKVFALTHNYSGYPMVRQAREMIRNGDLGELIAVRVLQQGWMHGMDTEVIPERGIWKSDPELNGRGITWDVGTHAFHLLRFVTGLIPLSLTCKMSSYSKHHNLDDYGQATSKPLWA